MGHFWALFGPFFGPLWGPFLANSWPDPGYESGDLGPKGPKRWSKKGPKNGPKKGPFSGLPQKGPKSGVLGHYRFLALFGPFFWAHFWLRERDFGPKNRVHFWDQLLTKRAKNGPKHGTVKGGPL